MQRVSREQLRSAFRPVFGARLRGSISTKERERERCGDARQEDMSVYPMWTNKHRAFSNLSVRAR
jgi:hypothetical protein